MISKKKFVNLRRLVNNKNRSKEPIASYFQMISHFVFKSLFVVMCNVKYVVSLLFVQMLLLNHVFSQTIEQRENLKVMEEGFRAESSREKKHAIQMAKQLDLPVWQEDNDGVIKELIYFIEEEPHYLMTNNKRAAYSVSTNKIQPGGITGYNLTGKTETIALWDGGNVYLDHQEFDGRASIGDVVLSSSSSHATHVAGTMVGKGVNSDAKGMAPEAKILSYGWGNGTSEMTAAAANGLLVSNHSYGLVCGWSGDKWYGNTSISDKEDYKFGFYGKSCQSWDKIANDAPYFLIVKSAGNDRGNGPKDGPYEEDGGEDGFDCIPTKGVAKNILTVGAVKDIPEGYSSPDDVVMTSFSSWGPADDGRIKPDLVGNGNGLYSATTGAVDKYSYKSGTSMSSPNVSGSIALLLEQQRNFYGDVVYRSSTIKGLLIHTADEAGPNPGPDYMFGWGLANFTKAAKLIEEDGNECINIREYNLEEDELITIPVIKKADEELRVTCCWNDPASPPQSYILNPRTPVLINDVDVRVVGGGTTHMPWKLSYAEPSKAANQGDNTVDNVEQVVVKNELNRFYTIMISHKGSLKDGSQIVSVLISGNKKLVNDENIQEEDISNEKAYWSRNRIESTSTVIRKTANVDLVAGDHIFLGEGFSVEQGANFTASLDQVLDCTAGTFGLKSTSMTSIPSGFVFERSEQKELNQEEEIDKPGISISPNPSTGLLSFRFKNDLPESIEFVNGTSGKIVYSIESIIKKRMKVDLTGFEKGKYKVFFLFEEEIISKELVLQ